MFTPIVSKQLNTDISLLIRLICSAMASKHQCFVTYKALLWMGFIFISTVFIVDRLTTNVSPRQSFARPGYGTGSDGGFAKSPWSWQINQGISRISGRYTMVALNALLFTSMHTLHARLSSSAVARYVDFTDETARLDIHKKVGISICFVTILHVWGILLPTIFQGYTIGVSVGTFTWPLSERGPAGMNKNVAETKHVLMQVDDVYRLVLMTLLLGPIIYFSVKRIATNYRFGIRLHQFVMVMYFIDIIRRHSHPHSWFLNIPMFLLWLLDNVVGLWYRHQRVDVTKVDLDTNSILLHWKGNGGQNKASLDSIGAIVRLNGFGDSARCRSLCTLEPSHPFTSFSRRNMTLKSVSNLADWDHAVIVRAYNKKSSYTRKLKTKEVESLNVWGPFQASAIPNLINSGHDLLLVGGGSGSGYLIDTLIYISSQPDTTKFGNIRLIFTSREVGVARFWISVLDDIYEQCARLSSFVRVKIALTTSARKTKTEMAAELGTGTTFTWGTVQFERSNLQAEAESVRNTCTEGKAAHVFCHGSAQLQKAARVAARKQVLRYHETHVYDDGPARAADPTPQEEALEIKCVSSAIKSAPITKTQVEPRWRASPSWFSHGGYITETHVCYEGPARAADPTSQGKAIERYRNDFFMMPGPRTQRQVEPRWRTPPSWVWYEGDILHSNYNQSNVAGIFAERVHSNNGRERTFGHILPSRYFQPYFFRPNRYDI